MYLTEEQFWILLIKKYRNRHGVRSYPTPVRSHRSSINVMSPVPPMRGSPRLPTLPQSPKSSLRTSPKTLPPSPRSSLSSLAPSLPPSPRPRSQLPPSPRGNLSSKSGLPTLKKSVSYNLPSSPVRTQKTLPSLSSLTAL